MPDRIASAFSNYKMNLVQVRESSRYHFRNEDVQTVFEISEYIYNERFDELQKKYGNRDIAAELAAVIGIITESNHIVKQAAEKEGGVINMCAALEKLEKRGIEQGISQRNAEIVLKMLKKNMDKGLIREITGVDEETLEKLYKEAQM